MLFVFSKKSYRADIR